MQIIFSPSKKQNVSQVMPTTQPKFQLSARVLLKKLAGLSTSDLQKQFKLSDSVARQLHYGYLNPAVAGNALSSFTGTSFSRLDLENYTDTDWDFAQDHVHIFSGVYGVLRARDAMVPYRLDWADNVTWMNLGGDLYDYWRVKVNEQLSGAEVILGLASGEYSRILSPENRKKLIAVDFLTRKNGSLRSVSVYNKHTAWKHAGLHHKKQNY